MRKKTDTRLSKKTWLIKALDVLSKRGYVKLRIDQLARDLGVTKGSFYWHFKNRVDFIQHLTDYWMEWSNEQVMDLVEKMTGSGEIQLWKLMENIWKNDLNKYDLPIRAWAAHDVMVAKLVKKVDEQRLGFARALFRRMGFQRDELETRARIWTIYVLGSQMFRGTQERKISMDELKSRHAFYVRP